MTDASQGRELLSWRPSLLLPKREGELQGESLAILVRSSSWEGYINEDWGFCLLKNE